MLRRFQRNLARQGWDLVGSSYTLQAEREAVVLPPEIQEALAENKAVTITYINSKGDETIRTITPLRVQVSYEYVYLTAYCHLRQAERHFRLDRIYAIERTELPIFTYVES